MRRTKRDQGSLEALNNDRRAKGGCLTEQMAKNSAHHRSSPGGATTAPEANSNATTTSQAGDCAKDKKYK